MSAMLYFVVPYQNSCFITYASDEVWCQLCPPRRVVSAGQEGPASRRTTASVLRAEMVERGRGLH